jgi:nucleotide-binding universal stress UspA family protein
MLAGVPYETLIEYGELKDVLAKLIKELEISLLVVGTHGRSGFRKLLIGSLAEQLLRTMECAVLTVPPHEPVRLHSHGRFQSVLFATAFSPGSMHALLYALGFAQESHARLTLLHVVEQSSATPLYIQDQLLKEAGKRLEEIRSSAADMGIVADVHAVNGIPIDEILQVANSINADLIVMGVQKSGNFGARAWSHLPWTIAQQVVCRAKCPVLTVRG